MKERLIEFLRVENKSSAQFAEEIGVQPSGISHIISGRNNPSLDLILKMLEKYPFLSTDWLLFGKGSMYKDTISQTLFGEEVVSAENSNTQRSKNEPRSPDDDKSEFEIGQFAEEDVIENKKLASDKTKPDVKRIVWFFDNNSFEEYFPHR